MIKHSYQLQEYSQLTDIDLTPEDVEMLLALFVGKLDVTANLTFGKYNLRSSQYVGIISLKNTKIIIEPKTKITNLSYMISKVYSLVIWQNALTECSSINEWSNLVLILFLNSITELVNKGLNQNFQEVKENSTTIRGNIDFVKQAKENFGYILQHHCSYTEISNNTIENQILKLALRQIYLICELDNELAWKLNKLEKIFTNVSLINFTRVQFSQLNFNRLNEHYRLPLALAEMILDMRNPLLEGNLHPFPAFLIDLNQLFERYVANHLIQACSKHNELLKDKLILSYQTQNYLDQNTQIKIIPDLVLTRGEKTLAVIDTKYKLASSEHSRDYYQIISYCLAQNTICGVLVYPNWESQKEKLLIKNSNITIQCVGITMDKRVEELNKSIEAILNIILN